MKHLLIAIIFIIPIGAFASAGPGGAPFSTSAGPDGILNGLLSTPSIHTNDQGTHVKFYVPGFLIKMAAGMAGDEVPKEARQALKWIKGVSVEVAEGQAFDRSFEVKAEKQRNRYDRKKRYRSMVSVLTADENVQVVTKQKKNGTIRRLIVLVCTDDTYVHVKVQTRIKRKDLKKLMKTLDFENILDEYVSLEE